MRRYRPPTLTPRDNQPFALELRDAGLSVGNCALLGKRREGAAKLSGEIANPARSGESPPEERCRWIEHKSPSVSCVIEYNAIADACFVHFRRATEQIACGTCRV